MEKTQTTGRACFHGVFALSRPAKAASGVQAGWGGPRLSWAEKGCPPRAGSDPGAETGNSTLTTFCLRGNFRVARKVEEIYK